MHAEVGGEGAERAEQGPADAPALPAVTDRDGDPGAAVLRIDIRAIPTACPAGVSAATPAVARPPVPSSVRQVGAVKRGVGGWMRTNRLSRDSSSARAWPAGSGAWASRNRTAGRGSAS
ncbi:hypothetical protein BJF78_22535 [Pseudonocardia sp. CNS-139]|nr:hypothetical protein BJF78_22535 [Pseudonocardia sp. CNS-139]